MNRLMLAVTVMTITLFSLAGCVSERVYYTPVYAPPYVRSVSYHTSPYWDVDYYSDSDAYYYGYDDLGDVGYWGMYNNYQVY